MSKQPSTPLTPPELRAGTYDHDEDVTGLLGYGTHTILDVPRDQRRLSAGIDPDRDLVLRGDNISKRHFVMERRERGMVVTDDGSKNGLAYEVKRDHGLALKPTFEDRRDAGEGFVLVPGMTFVVGADPNRFIALDDAMRAHHQKLVEILGREDEVRTATVNGETPSPSDLILAADSPGHLLITGRPGCEQQDLASIIHKLSKRRRQRCIELHEVPGERRRQMALVKHEATRGTLVLHLGGNRARLDPVFVSSIFSPAYNIRVIVVARTTTQARRALGHQHWRPLMHIALCPMAERRAAIFRLLDHWLAARGSVLRMTDLTPENQQALLRNPWRENLTTLREAADRLDAIVLAGLSGKKAAASLGLRYQSFYHWFNNAMRLRKPLVPEARKQALCTMLAARGRTPG